MFVLVVDNFGIQYTNKEDAKYLIQSLQDNYEDVTFDWAGAWFFGIQIEWNHQDRTVDISMPGYVEKVLHRFQPKATKQVHQPHTHNLPQYGTKVQLTAEVDASPPRDKEGMKGIMQIVGSLLFYARIVDATLLMSLSNLAAHKQKVQNTQGKQCISFWITVQSTQMQQSDTMQARGSANSQWCIVPLGTESKKQGRRTLLLGKLRIFKEPRRAQRRYSLDRRIFQRVMSLAAEAKVGDPFVNMKEGKVFRNAEGNGLGTESARDRKFKGKRDHQRYNKKTQA